MRSSVDNDMVRSVRAAGSGRKTRGRADTDWVDEWLEFAQLGLGQVVVGLLEGILDGPENLSVRSRVRAALQGLKGPKGFRFGPVSLPTSTGKAYRLRKGKPRLKGVGFGQFTKRVRLKPPQRIKVHRSKAFTVEDPLGDSILERGMGEAITLSVSTTDEGKEREALSLPAATTNEGKEREALSLPALTGDGLSLGAVPIPSVSSLAATVTAFHLGTEREGALEDGCPAKVGSSPGVESSGF
jgi:hypothetical protein